MMWPRPRRVRGLLLRLLCGALFALSPLFAAAQDTQEINRLIRLGQLDAATVKIDALLARNAKDPQARFFKGVVLSEQGKSADAITVFQLLTEDYPELPEPYNNLASLFAAKGQFEKAKIALEMAIQTNPAYATAYENLGDVYAKMASQAYDKALQLDKNNAAAQAKLTSIRNAFAASPKSAAPASAAPPKTDTLKPAAAAPITATPSLVKAAAPAMEASPTVSREPAAAVATPATAADSEAVMQAVNAWANAWATRDLDGYFGAYSKTFAPHNKSRAEWEAARRVSFPATKTVQLAIEQPQISVIDANQVQVTFSQRYRSERATLTTRKSLLLAREAGGWHIAQERVLP